MKNPIAPCPFCASQHLHVTSQGLTFHVACESCCSSGPRQQLFEEAIAEWNALSSSVAHLRADSCATETQLVGRF